MKHTIIRSTENGKPIVKVKLSNRDDYATVDAASYDKMITDGYLSPWRVNYAGDRRYCYVRTKYKGDNSSVARAILGEPRKHIISYLDGNPLNLRRDNLSLVARGRKLGRKDLKAQQSL